MPVRTSKKAGASHGIESGSALAIYVAGEQARPQNAALSDADTPGRKPAAGHLRSKPAKDPPRPPAHAL
ncbi:hypothetical protein ColKHC_10400 [Colletotrichum higginsianum]|nr:hypothetical protein ColKHC_10400 [Colletotrichum higginsianum]